MAWLYRGTHAATGTGLAPGGVTFTIHSQSRTAIATNYDSLFNAARPLDSAFTVDGPVNGSPEGGRLGLGWAGAV
ncbi:hypothetical protein ZHAS_00021192 [Anopheles sinensis]|uniref:Uncharacterized protein n=1 Tax=Anopheles sinensis TaxID=74873 RepID=A0A084WRR8_ANOSI|nr:hypothetical protein ZHAS_00021192 [Anopheles sinensis]